MVHSPLRLLLPGQLVFGRLPLRRAYPLPAAARRSAPTFARERKQKTEIELFIGDVAARRAARRRRCARHVVSPVVYSCPFPRQVKGPELGGFAHPRLYPEAPDPVVFSLALFIA